MQVMFLLGLVLGRWWRAALITAMVGGPLLLTMAGVVDDAGEVMAAMLLAGVSAGFGVLVHQGFLRGYRRLRDRSAGS